MSLDEWPGVFGFAAGDGGPKTKDLFQMIRPVVDLPEEDGSNDLMLSHVRIEVLQQGAKRLFAADTLKKGRSGFSHAYAGTGHSIPNVTGSTLRLLPVRCRRAGAGLLLPDTCYFVREAHVQIRPSSIS